MNLSDLREAVRVKTGYPERGATGTTRLTKVLNYALRHMWGEMPEGLLKSQHRFMLEPPITGQADIHFDDRFTWLVPASIAAPVLAVDNTLSARNFEVQLDGVWYQFRIRQVVRMQVRRVSGGPLVLMDVIVVDKPWFNGTSTNLPFRIYTDGYPYPADIQKVRTLVYNPEVEPRELPVSLHPEEMARMRLGYGWRNQGRIEFAASGDFFQLPAPHYTPVLGTAENQPWGYDDALVERGAAFPGKRYGAAGTFSYIVCHGWGRLPAQYMGVIDPSSNPDVVGDQPGRLLPFYLSSPSVASEQKTVTWGADGIKLTLPDIGYQHAQTNNATFPSYKKSGVEKWIFRARHATQSPTDLTNNADVKELEADGVYYLWRVVDGSTTTVVDKGQGDPVEKDYPLKDFHGHFHIRFDKAGDSKVPILMYTVRRPPTLQYETDAAAIPPECFEALTELAASYLVGDRDGAMDRKSAYYQSYLNELTRLRRLYSFPGYAQGPFGDGLNSRPRGMYIGGPIRSA